MVSSKSLISTAFAGLALATAASAQNTQLNFEKTGPVGQVHYDMATGKVTKVVRPRQVMKNNLSHNTQVGVQRVNVASFNNTLTSGYFTSGNLGSEFIDWAAKGTGLPFTTRIRFGYATRMDDPSIGTGAALDLSFYSGTSGGMGVCNLGTEFARLIFTGLPGRTASLPPNFGIGYNITATLNNGLCIPDGQIGWGYTFEDLNPLTGVSGTGPRMTDFGTNTGWADSFQFYALDPASLSSCVGTFFYGGCSTGNVPPPPTGTPCASFMMGLDEFQATTAASCAFRNTTNPVTWNVLNPPQLGGSFQAVTAGPFAGVAVTAGSFPGIPLFGTVNGSLLVDPTIIYGGIQVISTGSFTAPIPKDTGLEGVPVFTQAAVFAGPGNFQLSNAFDCVIGG
jgi:hypothetical protein